jgi:hypothetical protein
MFADLPQTGIFRGFSLYTLRSMGGNYIEMCGERGEGSSNIKISRKEKKCSKCSKVIYLHVGEVTADRPAAGSAPGDGTMPRYYPTSQRRPQRRAAAIATGKAL